MLCSIHNEPVKAYCAEEKRLVCAQCFVPVVGTCSRHASVSIDEAAAARRKDVEQIHATLVKNTASMEEETERVRAVQAAAGARLIQLGAATRHNRVAEHGIEQLLALQDNTRSITTAEAEVKRAVDGAVTASELVREGEEELRVAAWVVWRAG